jgi:hypothetical protein
LLKGYTSCSIVVLIVVGRRARSIPFRLCSRLSRSPKILFGKSPLPRLGRLSRYTRKHPSNYCLRLLRSTHSRVDAAEVAEAAEVAAAEVAAAEVVAVAAVVA